MARPTKPSPAVGQGVRLTGPPCAHREVASDGRIVCRKILRGDPGVSPELCARCPAEEIGCRHLRFSLRKETFPSIHIYYSSGRTAVLEEEPPALSFVRAGCELYVRAVPGAETCLGCPERTRSAKQGLSAGEPVGAQETNVVPFPRARAAGG
jgi:hypothetical protein